MQLMPYAADVPVEWFSLSAAAVLWSVYGLIRLVERIRANR